MVSRLPRHDRAEHRPTLPGMEGWADSVAIDAKTHLVAYLRGAKRQRKVLRHRSGWRATWYFKCDAGSEWPTICTACGHRVLKSSQQSHIGSCPTIALFVKLGGCYEHDDCRECHELGWACLRRRTAAA